MADAMIRVPAHVRDRLAVLAEARGTSIRALIQQFAEATLTPEERAAKVEETKAYVHRHFGVNVTDEDLAETKHELTRFFAQQDQDRHQAQTQAHEDQERQEQTPPPAGSEDPPSREDAA
ncbi:hypothetical protein [Streptomyces phytohabitans]|uniref:hypothetical protein n=1 Tax=Streptomyces phytohabitans TaxID=1150371 RepID=UPI00345BDD3A